MPGDARGGSVSLHDGREQNYVDILASPACNLKDVAQGRARGACDHSDCVRKSGEGLFSRLVKEAFRVKLFLPFLKHKKNVSASGQFHRADYDLVVAARGVDGKLSFYADKVSVFGSERQARRRSLPHNRRDLRSRVLDHKINVAA